MVQINHIVDVNAVVQDFSPLPDGDYVAIITSVTKQESKKDPRNQMLKVEFQLEQENRRIWHNLNLWHENENAVRIAKQELNSIAIALGLQHIGDTEEMVGRSLVIIVGTEAASGNYAAKNVARGFTPTAQPVPYTPPPVQTMQPAPPTPQVTTQTEAAAPVANPEPKPAWHS